MGAQAPVLPTGPPHTPSCFCSSQKVYTWGRCCGQCGFSRARPRLWNPLHPPSPLPIVPSWVTSSSPTSLPPLLAPGASHEGSRPHLSNLLTQFLWGPSAPSLTLNQCHPQNEVTCPGVLRGPVPNVMVSPFPPSWRNRQPRTSVGHTNHWPHIPAVPGLGTERGQQSEELGWSPPLFHLWHLLP